MSRVLGFSVAKTSKFAFGRVENISEKWENVGCHLAQCFQKDSLQG